MKSRRLIMLLLCLLAANNCQLAAQTFLRLDNITGSSTDTNHVGWMDIQSATVVDVTITGIGGGGISGSISNHFGAISFSKYSDIASPTLAVRCASGTLINSGTVDFTEVSSSGARYLRMNLTNIYITSFNQSGSGDFGESFSLLPLNYSWNYTHYSTKTGLPDAYVFSGWDILTNSGTLGTNNPAFVTTGIRNNAGVKLSWNTTAGKLYRIYAVSDLRQPFMPIALLTATTTGTTNYIFVPVAPAMFYTVEQVPDGY
jgi:type VI secretion system secreted protein Hcp